MATLISLAILGVACAMPQASTPASASQPTQQESDKSSPLSPSKVHQLQAKAEAGDAGAQAALGEAYRDGKGVSKSDTTALKWFRKAADQGDGAAENSLGLMYRMGQGVARDSEEAVRWYKKAAKHGNGTAMFNLGAAYYDGDGVPSDPNSAYAWFLLAQEAGSPPADDAVKRSAEEGERLGATQDALQQVAAMYEEGDALQQSYAEAAKWYRKAADAGSSQARVKLASMFIDGRGVQRDYGQAMILCRDAAKQNYASGQYCVGYIYQHGLGTPADSKEAAKWYELASKGGHQKAIMDLAEMYWKGEVSA
jgi:TPR repeat protein